MNPFHLAIPVHDLASARKFYGELLGATEGRTSSQSIVFNFFGHQLVVHVVDNYRGAAAGTNLVDRHNVPVPHFGIVLDLADWKRLAKKLMGKVDFIIEPSVRYEGTTGEQHTMFFADPSGNALEFKGFADVDSQVFAPN